MIFSYKILIILTLLFFGCNRNNKDYINSYKISKKLESIDQIKFLPFKWNTPANWLPNEKSAMRVASYLIPTSNGSADLSVIYLNGDGGGVTANVNRWRKQLKLNELNTEQINSSAENFNGSLGIFQIYEIINPANKESAFLCSIIPANEFTIFIKLDTYLDNIDSLKEELANFSLSFEYNE